MPKTPLTTNPRQWVLLRRLLYAGLFLSSLLSLCKFLFFFSETWMANHSKSNFLPKTRILPSEEEISHNISLLFQQIEGQLMLCDIKAYLTIIADTLLIILLTFAETQNVRAAFLPSAPPQQRLAVLCIFSVLCALLFSCLYAVRAVLPTLQDRDRITLMYFGHIAELHHDKFVSNFQSQPLRELKESLLTEVHAKSRIARRKLSYVSWSVSFFFAALLFWLLAQFFFLLL
ncbi:MAG TPA: Pycsar system effector family protein [Ktedonobacteraceae bacterium]